MLPQRTWDSQISSRLQWRIQSLFSLDFVETYIALDSMSAHDDIMLYDCIINIFSSEGLSKISNCSEDYHRGDYKSGILLIKAILDESGMQTNTTVVKENFILANLSEIIVWLIHNMSNFNAQVLLATKSLKRNGSSAPDMLHQMFPAYLTCSGFKFQLTSPSSKIASKREWRLSSII